MKTNVMLIIPEMCMGGAQRSLANLSHELAKKANIFFVVFNNQEAVYYTVSGTLLSLEVYPGKGWLNKGLALWKRIKKLKELKTKLAIDVSISFLEGADYVNMLSRGKEKVILSVRGSKLHDEIMRGYHFWFRSKILIPSIYKKADLIVTVNQGIKNELVDYYGLANNKIQVINNFYDLSEIGSRSKELKEGILEELYQHPTIVTTGRLAPEKRLPYLVQIFKELKQIKRDVRFVIVGEGPERKKIIEICEQTNLRLSEDFYTKEMPDVFLTGNQQNVFKYLHGSSLYLMNSSSEGFPNGMIEAMICGVPIISTDCPYGPREILAPEIHRSFEVIKQYNTPCGILMPLPNSNGERALWVNAIISILDNDVFRNQMVDKGKERVKEFDKTAILSKWSSLIER